MAFRQVVILLLLLLIWNQPMGICDNQIEIIQFQQLIAMMLALWKVKVQFIKIAEFYLSEQNLRKNKN